MGLQVDGYHPHLPGMKKKLDGLGFQKQDQQEIPSGKEISTQTPDGIEHALAVIGGRILLQMGGQSETLHQGDILMIQPNVQYRFKVLSNVPAKIIRGRKGMHPG